VKAFKRPLKRFLNTFKYFSKAERGTPSDTPSHPTLKRHDQLVRMAQLFEKQWPMQPGNGWALDKLIVSQRLQHVKEVWRQTGQEDTKDAEVDKDAEVNDPNDPDKAQDGESDDDGKPHKKPASKEPASPQKKPAAAAAHSSARVGVLGGQASGSGGPMIVDPAAAPRNKQKPATTQKKPASRNKQEPASRNKLMAAKKMRR